MGDDDGLSRHAQDLLAALGATTLAAFTMEDLLPLRPQWSRYAFRAALEELRGLDYVTSPRGGRGKLREYVMHRGAAHASQASGRIRLRAVGELAKVGETDFANFTPVAGSG